MTKVLVKHTKISCNLSIVISNETNKNIKISVIPLVSLVYFIMLFWKLYTNYRWLKVTLLMLKEKLLYRLNLSYKIALIGFNSLMWTFT